MKDILPYILPLLVHAARYFLFAGIPFLIFYILFPQVFSSSKIQARLARHSDFLREISHSLQSIFIFALVGILIMKTPLGAYTQLYTEVADHGWWWIPISVLLALVLHDTYFYWMHRAVHHPKLYRRVHLVHHQSVNPSPWTSYSFHFLEGLLEAMVAPLILFLIPMHPLALVLFSLASFLINVYGHLGYEIAPRWFRHSLLFEVLNTSTHHNLHHAKFRGNYGLYFRIWDRLMGTEHPDYVQEYDCIQARRFGEYTPAASWKGGFGIGLLLLIGGLMLSVASSSNASSIEGKWMYRDQGAVMLIYEQEGRYFGKLIDTGNAADNEKLQAHGDLLILKDFQKISQTKYCCGTLFAPRRNKTLAATITLENPNTLRIEGRLGVLSGSETLVRLTHLSQ